MTWNFYHQIFEGLSKCIRPERDGSVRGWQEAWDCIHATRQPLHFLDVFLLRGKVISRSLLVIHPFTSVRTVSICAARCSAHSYTEWICVIYAWTCRQLWWIPGSRHFHWPFIKILTVQLASCSSIVKS